MTYISLPRLMALLLAICTFIPAVAVGQVALPGAPKIPEAQTAPPPPTPPPPLWFVSGGAGVAITSGNSDTSTVNLAYELKRDGGQALVYRSAGLYLRGKSEDEVTVDRALLDNRVDRGLTERLSAFGQLGYLRDRFKEIDYLVSPGGGLSYGFIKNARMELNGDGGLGVIFEKNTGFDLDTSGSVLGGERFQFNLSETARITQALAALWKMDDFEDALYTFTIGVASSLTANSQVKVELLDNYKNKPTTDELEKNDVSILVSFVYKLTRQ